MICLIGLVVFVCGICLAYSSADRYGEVQFVRQMVGRSETERTIVWQSDVIDERMVVEYRRQNGSDIKRVRPTAKQYDIDGTTFFRYRADIADLLQNTVYEYRIANDERKSAWRRLTTKADSYTAVVFTDSQCAGDYRPWAELVRAAEEREGNTELCLHLGDLVDCGASQYQWSRWLLGAEPILEECAFAPTMGNHEDYTCDWQMMLPQFYRALFPVPKRSDHDLDGHVYSFDYGDVHYVVLDTQAEELSRWKTDWTARQAEWLARDLAQTNAKWKIILCHKPFYEIDGTMTEYGRAWLPICRSYGVQLILSGHHHIYARAVIDGITMITAGVSGDGTGYMPQENKQNIAALTCDIPNYLTLKITPDALHIRAIQMDGRLLDEAVIPSRQ